MAADASGGWPLSSTWGTYTEFLVGGFDLISTFPLSLYHYFSSKFFFFFKYGSWNQSTKVYFLLSHFASFSTCSLTSEMDTYSLVRCFQGLKRESPATVVLWHVRRAPWNLSQSLHTHTAWILGSNREASIYCSYDSTYIFNWLSCFGEMTCNCLALY